MLTFGSLFAGIGGFDLGFERAGFQCKWQVEIDDYANKILERHWPDVHRERDIRQCGRHNLERVDCIIGGFPCQDISYAGKGAGLDGARSGLFFEAIRLVCQLRPRAVVLENVAGLLTRGLDRVLGTLAEIGFDAEWHCIPAAAVGAPHIRDRVFILAYRNGESAFAEHAEVAQLPSGDVADAAGIRKRSREGCGCNGRRRIKLEGTKTGGNADDCCKASDVADTEHDGFAAATGKYPRDKQHQRRPKEPASVKQPTGSGGRCKVSGDVADSKKHGRYKGESHRRRCEEGTGAGQECGLRDGGETVPDTDSNRREGRWKDGKPAGPLGLRSGAGGNEIERVRRAFADWWAIEPDVGRVANGISKRVDRLRCLGNAIVPQVAEVVARMAMDRLTGGE